MANHFAVNRVFCNFTVMIFFFPLLYVSSHCLSLSKKLDLSAGGKLLYNPILVKWYWEALFVSAVLLQFYRSVGISSGSHSSSVTLSQPGDTVWFPNNSKQEHGPFFLLPSVLFIITHQPIYLLHYTVGLLVFSSPSLTRMTGCLWD